MQLIRKILHRLDGLRFPQEYLCFAKENFSHPLHAWLVSEGHVVKDITNSHAFTGYNPLIFALIFPGNENKSPLPGITVALTTAALQPNDKLTERDAIAWLSLKKINQQTAGTNSIVYYEGIRGKHRFVPAFNQFIIGLINQLYNKKQGNVFLNNNLYRQVQAAYALPRTISLITVRENDRFNLFPTDLHGKAGDDFYIISLRHEGKACRQVEQAKKILLSEVHADAFKKVYSLGKNHMQDPKKKEEFPFGQEKSEQFGLPVPETALYCRELELKDSFIHGIHRLMLFRVVSKRRVLDIPATLAHIHNSYASWRYNKGLAGNYLLR